MLFVDPIGIPAVLPAADVIASMKDNRHSYEPEVWEFQYQSFRYLEDVSDQELTSRYRGLLRNLSALATADRNVIPIQSFLSAWYWLRKEHQTRLEFYLRKIATPERPLSGLGTTNPRSAPIRPAYPNAGDVLFRYGKKSYMDEALTKGRFRIATAEGYLKMEEDAARQDDELNKHTYVPSRHTKITHQSGRTMKPIGNIRYTASAPGYLLLCVALDWDEALFDDFGADACLIIRDAERFSDRLQGATSDLKGRWALHHFPVEYFDPYERRPEQAVDPVLFKDFKYAYQREYRFVWIPNEPHANIDAQFIECGSLEEIAEVVGNLQLPL